MDIPTRPRTRAHRRSDTRWEATDAELMALVRSGDMGAFAELHARHSAVARATAVALGGSRISADDVVNEAFTKLLEAVERGFGPTEAFRPYLLQCVRSVVFSGGRRSGREELAEDVPEAPNAVDAFDLADENSVVASAFAALPDRWQAVLWMLEVEGKSTSEVAEQLRIRPNAVAALAYRAREGLKERYLARHVEVGPAEECKAIAPLLAGHVRASLGAREQMRVDAHLEVCEPCRDAREELAGLDRSLSRMLIPLFPGMGFAGAGLLGGPVRFVARRWKQVAVGAGATGAAAGLTVLAVTAFSGEAQRRPADRTELAGPVETTSTTRRAGQAFGGQSQFPVTTVAPGSSVAPATVPAGGTEDPTSSTGGTEVVTVVFPPDGGAPEVTVTTRSTRPRPTTTAPPEVLPDVVEPTTTTTGAPSSTSPTTTATTRPTPPTTVIVLPPVPTTEPPPPPPSSTLPPDEFRVKAGEQNGEGRVKHIRLDVFGAVGTVTVRFSYFDAGEVGGTELLDIGGPGWQCVANVCTADAKALETLTLKMSIPDGGGVRVSFLIVDGAKRSIEHEVLTLGEPTTTTTSSSTTTTTIDDTTSSTIDDTVPDDTLPPGSTGVFRR